MATDAGLRQGLDGCEITAVCVLGEVKVAELRRPCDGFERCQIAHDLDVARANTKVGVDDIDVRKLSRGDPLEVRVHAVERQLVDAAGHCLPPVAERAGKRTASIGFDDGHAELASVAVVEGVECAVHKWRGCLAEVRQTRTRRSTHVVLRRLDRTNGQTRDGLEVATGGTRPQNVAERQFTLTEYEDVYVWVGVKEASDGLGPPRHGRSAKDRPRIGVSRLGASRDFKRVARIPRVTRIAEDVWTVIRRNHLVRVEALDVDGELETVTECRVRP